MKKLEKLTLKELGNQTTLIKPIELNKFNGGGIDDNDCVVEAIAYYGCSEGEVWQQYANMYGWEAMSDAMNNGMDPGTASSLAYEMLNCYSISNANQLDSSIANGDSSIVTIQINGNYHAVIIEECSADGTYVYTDPETGNTNSISAGEINFSFAVSVSGAR